MYTAVLCAVIVIFTFWIKRKDWFPGVQAKSWQRGRKASGENTTPTASPPAPATPTPAKTPAATQAAKPIAWKKWVGATIGWVVLITVVGFLAKAGYDNYTRPGHGVIGAVGQFFSPDRTETQTQQRKVVVVGKTTIVTAPPAPEWSEIIPTPGPFSVNPDEGAVISVRKSNGTIVNNITRDLGGKIGNTFTIEIQSEKETPAKVAVVK